MSGEVSLEKIRAAVSWVAQELPEVEVACDGCHEEPHQGDDAPLLNMHLGRVACQTCHIPLIARDPDFGTQMTRDYTRPTLDEATGLYGPQVGMESDVVPTYLWWQGRQMESPSRPVGSIDDPGHGNFNAFLHKAIP